MSYVVVPRSAEVDGVTIDLNASGELQIKGGAVTADLIANDAVTRLKILDANVTAQKILSFYEPADANYTAVNASLFSNVYWLASMDSPM